MSPEVAVNLRKFVDAHASIHRTQGAVAALPFKIPFLDDALAEAVKLLTAADQTIDVIVDWLPEITMTIVNSALSVKEIVENILAKIQAAGG